jgi:hypothetical protein
VDIYLPVFGQMAAGLAALCLGIYFVIVPITKAFCGRKKLLVYTSLHPLSRIKNIVFIHQARDSFRSKALFEALKKWPAARIDRQLS